MKRGLYRVHGVGGLPDDVRMEDDGIEVPLEESLYRARGYLPRVDDLLWKEQHQSGHGSAASQREGDDKVSRDQARQEFLKRFKKS